MRIILASACVLLLTGCLAEEKKSQQDISAKVCRGIYYDRDSLGNLKKFNQYELDGSCKTDNLPLSHYEATKEAWDKNNVKCTPQPGFSSRTLVANNNFYDYRDGKAYLDFDSATGVYRRIILAENTRGEPLYAKLQGCFYQRTGSGVDAGFGKQLLLDTDVNKIISSQYFDPFEIFSYSETATEVDMVRFDDTQGYDYRNCPYLRTPWKFCEKLRDGNDMYFPVLSAAEMSDLTNEAIVISRQFNWTVTSRATFDSMWNTVDQSRKEGAREDYLFDVIHIVDTPRFTSNSWRDYLMGTRPTMPDVNSSNAINLCYAGSKNITYADGSTGRIFGEVCYIDGQYVFTQN